MSFRSEPGFKPALIKPTYDVANFGHDSVLPLNCLSGSTATLTPSTATFVQVLEDSRVPIDEVDMFITDSDKMEFMLEMILTQIFHGNGLQICRHKHTKFR